MAKEKLLKKAIFVGFFIIAEFCVNILNLSKTRADLSENDPHFTTRENISRNQIVLGLEYTFIHSDSTDLNGVGVRFGWEAALNDRWSVLPTLGMAFGVVNISGYLYTGFST